MIIERNLLHQINPFLKRKEFISIIGPRQSGKTTFLKILRDYLIRKLKLNKNSIPLVSFEDRKLLLQFEKDPLSFVNSYIAPSKKRKSYLMIDEFQYAQDGGQKLKLIYDLVENIKIFITGSSSLEIKAKVGKFMVGRILNFNLSPFNFEEYLRANNSRLEKIYTQNNQQFLNWLFEGKQFKIKKGNDLFFEELIPEFERYCLWGGYPAVVLSKNDTERRKILSDIYNNYILKDIKTLLELATEKNLYLLSQYLATQIGSTVVYQNLSITSGLNYRQLKKHLNILEETFICKEVNPFFRNKQKELSKNPKIFFLDMGFRNNLIENMNSLDKRQDAGAIIENSVFIKLNELYQGINKINFWRTKTGAEVDFVLQIENNLIPVEVKYKNFNSEKLSKSFVSFLNTFKPKHALVLTKNYWGLIKRNETKILFIPVYYL